MMSLIAESVELDWINLFMDQKHCHWLNGDLKSQITILPPPCLTAETMFWFWNTFSFTADETKTFQKETDQQIY